ncbi:type II toxin-antitoxin system HicA family toxin [Candidatus Parcubacteria bacterium]|nr:type II toxin-antitoxin system HicA family toxin [Candidatus Parcubacteria bacterium]
MPKLPVIKSKELAKFLNKIGFFEYHQTGSHIQFKHSDGRRTTISFHPGKDIPRGTLKAILRDLKISNEEFIKLLKK